LHKLWEAVLIIVGLFNWVKFLNIKLPIKVHILVKHICTTYARKLTFHFKRKSNLLKKFARLEFKINPTHEMISKMSTHTFLWKSKIYYIRKKTNYSRIAIEINLKKVIDSKLESNENLIQVKWKQFLYMKNKCNFILWNQFYVIKGN